MKKVALQPGSKTTKRMLKTMGMDNGNELVEGKENLFVGQTSAFYILKHPDHRRAWSVHIYCNWCYKIFSFSKCFQTEQKNLADASFLYNPI